MYLFILHSLNVSYYYVLDDLADFELLKDFWCNHLRQDDYDLIDTIKSKAPDLTLKSFIDYLQNNKVHFIEQLEVFDGS